MGQRVGSVVVPAVVGLLGAVWAAQPNAEGGELRVLIVMASLVVGVAVLTRQTVLGYGKKNWRLAFALFLVLFLGATVLPSVLELDLFEGSPFDSDWEKFAVILFASAFLAGVFAFWTRYLLALVPVIAGAVLVALVVSSFGITKITIKEVPVIVVAGIAGGAWFHWWLDRRKTSRTKSDAGSSDLGEGDADE